jgi:hypothetical protein
MNAVQNRDPANGTVDGGRAAAVPTEPPPANHNRNRERG